jgi:hypothetical protein
VIGYSLSPGAIRKLLASYPICRWCPKRVVAGQRDGEGVPAHFCCQLACIDLGPPNPRLPQLRQEQP